MKCTLEAGIESMSGKCGSLVFRTYKRPDGKSETRAYALPRKGWNNRTGKPTYGYTRTSKPTEKEVAARARFATFSEIVNNMPHEEKMKYAKEMKAAKFKFNGKEYATLRGYIIARLYAEKVV